MALERYEKMSIDTTLCLLKKRGEYMQADCCAISYRQDRDLMILRANVTNLNRLASWQYMIMRELAAMMASMNGYHING